MRYIESARQIPGRLLINHHDWRGARAIAIFNSAPGFYGDFERSEIPRIDHLYTNEERLLHSPQADPLAPPHTLKRQVEREGCLLDAGHGSEPFDDGFIECRGAFRSRVCSRWKIGRHRNHVVDSYPGIHLLKFRQALEQECRAADQHNRSRNFPDDDCAAHRCARARRSTRRLIQ